MHIRRKSQHVLWPLSFALSAFVVGCTGADETPTTMDNSVVGTPSDTVVTPETTSVDVQTPPVKPEMGMTPAEGAPAVVETPAAPSETPPGVVDDAKTGDDGKAEVKPEQPPKVTKPPKQG